jgi:hypothetical protein
MSVQLQDRYNDGVMPQNTLAFGDPFSPQNYRTPPAFPGSDTISRLLNPGGNTQNTGTASNMSPSSLISQLFSLLSQLLSSLSGNNNASEQYFNAASGGSNGDPHLSFNGNTWNDMQGQSDLLDSDSIRGGYQLSTQTTTPSANGVTYNQQATVTTGHGNTSVTLDKNGNASLVQNGVVTSIANGQTIDLGRGETVTRNQDGSLSITSTAANGGLIATTMSENGKGVDVNVTAKNVDLGGALVSG